MDNFNETSGSKVEFENQWERPSGYLGQRKPSKIVELLIKYSRGYIKDEQQANYILIACAVVAIIISIILFSRLSSTPSKAVQFREDIPLEIKKSIPPDIWETIPSKFK